MSDVIDAVAVVQVQMQSALVIQYEAGCGACGLTLWRRAAFRRMGVDYIACAHCQAVNVVRRPR